MTIPSVGNLRITSSTGQAGAGRQDELAVLDERARVAQVVDVLAGRALAGAAALGDGVGPGLVERDAVALEDLGEVGADVVEVDLVVAAVAVVGDVGLLEKHEHVALVDGVAGPRRDSRRIRPLGGALIDVLHLHGLDARGPADRRRPRRRGDVCRLTIVPCIGAPDGDRAGRQVGVGRPPALATRRGARRRLAELEDGERVGRVEPHAGAAAASGRRRTSGEATARVPAGWPSSSARCSSTKRVVAVDGQEVRVLQHGPQEADVRRRRPRCGTRRGAAARLAARRPGRPSACDTMTLASSESKFGLVR